MVDMQPSEETMISDGKRMRMVWRPIHGNGNSAQHLVDRSMNTIKGHPTWKIFISDIQIPIIRGSDDEPPRYVYLDDQACYIIWCTGVYTKDELRAFWPFDFDHQGNIKMGRKNRGRPAYLDESETKYATAPLRGKDKWYEFFGAPEVTDYKPVRPKVKSKMEVLVAKEFAEKACEVGPGIGRFVEGIQHSQSTDEGRNGSVIIATEAVTTTGLPITDTDDIYPSRPIPRPNSAPRQIPASSLQLGIKPLSLPPRSLIGTSYGDTTASDYRTAPRATAGDLKYSNRKRCVSEAFSLGDQQTVKQAPKRPYIQPFSLSSSDTAPTTPSPKCDALDPRLLEETPSKVVWPSFGCDGANDENVVSEEGKEDEEPLAMHSLRRQMVQLETQLVAERERAADLKQDNEALATYVKFLKAECNHYRAVIRQLLANNFAHQLDLTNRVIAFQKASDTYNDLAEQVKREADTAAREIAPTLRLCEDLKTVSDGPGKYMYEHGLDEEWKSMQDEARKTNDLKGSPSSSQPVRRWNFS